MDNAKSSLVVVGTGIKFLSHLTTEAKAYIEQSDKVLYLVNDPAMKQWIEKANQSAESLDHIYFSYTKRMDAYSAITNYILSFMDRGLSLCVAFYGHPTIFAQPALDAVRIAKSQNYYAKVLPGISAEDCLFADLLVDPGSCGSQSYEATDFVIYNRVFDPCSHLILWQIGMMCATGFEPINSTIGIEFLTNHLFGFYSTNHNVFIYEAAQYPGFEPKITCIELQELPKSLLGKLSTLYVPPALSRDYDSNALNELNLNFSYF